MNSQHNQRDFKRITKIFQMILFLSVVGFLSGVYAEATKITSRLQEKLEHTGPSETFRVLIYLADQVDMQILDQELTFNKASLQYRHKIVVESLQEKALLNQQNILSYIQREQAQGKITFYTSFWIINAINLETTADIIYDLSRRTDVKEIDIDGLLELEKPVSSKPSMRSSNSAEPGLKVINADKLWKKGITGQGVIVMNIDSGVNGSHPALAARWRGNEPGVPASAAWFDPANNTTFPTDGDGTYNHGTHTMGILTGLDPATNDTVGVAFGAKWIASNSLIGGNPHTSRTLSALQWAADPDGNSNTVDDVPVVINCSWRDPNFTNECSTGNSYYDAINALEVLGSAVVFSAGNDGPASQTIISPKNGIFTPVNIWATGAIDGSNPTYPVASFSSRGPSSCDGVTKKPEAVAPGVNVRSSQFGDYGLLSGTSQAAPHIAGAIALLKSAFPHLTGTELKEVLLNTAIDLGTAGEDNDYGMGLIDVEAAYNLLKPDVLVDQKLEDGITSVDNVGRWEGGPAFVLYEAPKTFSFTVGLPEVLQGAQKIISGQKYNQWNDDPDVINHHVFTIDTSFTNVLTSRFNSTKPGIILRNEFILGGGVDPSNDLIDFKDPWLIDYPDPQYGNNKRNQGMSAPFKSRLSPFNPDYTTNYNGDVYRGVFLNQNPQFQQGKPIYSVRAVNGQVVTVNGKDITYDWESWGYNPAQISLQTPGSRETAVVFKQDGATLTANMKGRRISDTPQATRFNNGRKLTYRRASITQQKPYLVYQDRGHIYAAFQDANGNWQKESHIAAAGGGRLNQLPAVAYLEEMSGYQDQHGIAWQEYDPLLNSYRLYSNLAGYPDGSPTFEDAPRPAIAGYYLYSPQAPTAVVAYRDSRFSPIDIPDGINLWFTRDGALATVTSEASADFPTLAQRHYPTSVQWQEPYYMLAWQESAGIRYKEFARNNDSGSQITYAFSSLLNSGYSSLTANQRPSLYSFGVYQNPDNEEHVYAVWQATYSSGLEEKRSGNPRGYSGPAVCFREKDPFWGWLPINIFRVSFAMGDLNPVVTGWQDGESFEAALAYQDVSGTIKYITRQQGEWSAAQLLSSDGVNPALATIGNVPQAIYTGNTSTPRVIQHNAALVSGMESVTALSHSREVHFSLKAMLRNGDRLPFDAEIALSLGDPSLLTSSGEEILKPLYRDSSLTPANIYHYREFPVNEAGARLRLPLALSARILGGKAGGPEGFELPMLRLKLMERGKPFPIKQLRSLLTGLLQQGDSTITLADTLQVDLSAYRGRVLQVVGSTFFRSGSKFSPAIAEVYDLSAPVEAKKTQKLPVAEVKTSLPEKFELSANYPNPFNPSTIVEFGIPMAEWVTITIYDLAGRKVATVVDKALEAGRYQVEWNGTNDRGQAVASGVYLYRLQAGSFTQVRKMILMK